MINKLKYAVKNLQITIIMLVICVIMTMIITSCENNTTKINPVTGITLNTNVINLTEGTSHTLTASITPEDATNKGISWVSNNESIATVSSDGIITAIAIGTATIIVSTTDGGFVDTCQVTVNPTNVSVTGVDLNKSSTSILIGNTETLSAIVSPSNATNQNVTWSSSDTTVATVNEEGIIIALAEGTTIITVTTEDGGFTAACQVTVSEDEVSVTGVTLNQTSLDLYVGSSETLIAIIEPSNATNQNLSWSSSNESVASVSAFGMVTGITKGMAIITVTTEDGDFTATCEINISEVQISVTGVTLNKSSLDLDVNSSETLIATIIPSNATNQNVSWSSSNESVASVSDSGLVFALSAGSSIITVTTEDGHFTDTCLVTVNPEPPVTATVTLNLSTSDGGSVIGSTVFLQEHGGDTYQENATNSSVIFTNIPFGIYSVEISHSGYYHYVYDALSVQETSVNHAIHLVAVTIQIGEIIPFGENNWIVLDIQDGKALIFCETVFPNMNYNSPYGIISWADSNLREYLNGEFYNSNVFSDEDRSRIVEVTNINEDNQWYETTGGENTQDKIFLLSISEIVQYFGDSGQLENRPPGAYLIDDQYNPNRIAFNQNGGISSRWWLRSPGRATTRAAAVIEEGKISMMGGATNRTYAVRPALWIEL
ncbi:MAG: Ig-like domain-containing protein [Candidatus Cloacimonetes bacterium]|nr:Ig-like domain-containing protein [Candidatus Cloacimonadota bacterium]